MIPEPRLHFESMPLYCGPTIRVLQEGRGRIFVIGWVRQGGEDRTFVFRPVVPGKGWGEPGAPGATAEDAVRLWMRHAQAPRRE